MGELPATVKQAIEAGGDAPGSSLDAGPSAEQVDMFADAPVLGAELQLVNGGRAHARRIGRPPGAKNRRTEDVARYILAHGRDPLIGLAEIVATPIHVLARNLGCKPLEAGEFWRRCSNDLLRYVHQEQPKAVQVTSDQQILVAFGDIRQGSQASIALGELGIGLEVINERLQEVEQVEAEAVARQASHEGGKDE